MVEYRISAHATWDVKYQMVWMARGRLFWVCWKSQCGQLGIGSG